MCPPADSSLGGYGILPYPRHLLWDILPQNTPNSQNLLLRCPPTDFTDLHRYLGCAVLPQNSQNLAAWVWQGCHTLLICAHLCHLWEALLCKRFLCVPCVLWEYLFSHGFHRFTQILRVRCSPTEFTEFGSVGMAGMPYPPTSVRIRVICGRLFSARGSVSSVRSVEISFLPRISQIYTSAPPGLAAWVWQGCHTLLHLCSSVPSVGVLSLQEVLCIRCIPSSPLVRLVQFLLWQAAKPSGDSCTPWRNPRK